MTDADLRSLLQSWRLHLGAQRKSRNTIKSYATGVILHLEFCEAEGIAEPLTKDAVNTFVVAMLDRGAEATTAASRQLAVRRFTAWLTDEGEIPNDPLLGLRAPQFDQKLTPRLTEEECAALVKACQGKDFRDRRDEAIVRMMLGAPMRAGEVIAQGVDDFDLPAGQGKIFGKGRKYRVVPLGPQVVRSLDRYLRMRRTHKLANTDAMWLGERGTGFGYQGLYSALRYRAQAAGLTDFHPHVLRHTAAQRFRAAGGSEEGLMSIGGWTDRATMDRYTRATSSERALAEAHSLNLDDF